MTDKFLSTGNGNVSISNGTADFFGATLGAVSLDPSQPVKTNSIRQLVSGKLSISDIINLQAELDSGGTDAQNITAVPGVTKVSGVLEIDTIHSVTDAGVAIYGDVFGGSTVSNIILDGTDVNVNATNFIVNGDNVPNQITALETKTQNLTSSVNNTTVTGDLRGTGSLGTVANPWNTARIGTVQATTVFATTLVAGGESIIPLIASNSTLITAVNTNVGVVQNKTTALETKTQHQTVTNIAPFELTQSFGYMTSNILPAPYVASGSTPSTEWPAYHAFDPSIETFYTQNSVQYDASNNYTGTNGKTGIVKLGEWLVLDMSLQYSVKSVQLTGRPGNIQTPLEWSIIYSNDGITYETAFYTNTQAIDATERTVILPNIIMARYIGIQVHRSAVAYASICFFKINVELPVTKFDGSVECNNLKCDTLNVDDVNIGGSITDLESKTQNQTVSLEVPFELTQSFGYMTSAILPAPYVVTTSSSTFPLWAPFQAFNNSITTGWITGPGLYSTGFNNYTGSAGKTGIAKLGEWLVLDMSLQYSVKSLQLTARNTNTQTPLEWSIIYSNDGIIYETAYYTNSETINATERTVLLPNITICRYIGIQVHRSTDNFASIMVFKINVETPKTKFNGRVQCEEFTLNSSKITIGENSLYINPKTKALIYTNNSIEYPITGPKLSGTIDMLANTVFYEDSFVQLHWDGGSKQPQYKILSPIADLFYDYTITYIKGGNSGTPESLFSASDVLTNANFRFFSLTGLRVNAYDAINFAGVYRITLCAEELRRTGYEFSLFFGNVTSQIHFTLNVINPND